MNELEEMPLADSPKEAEVPGSGHGEGESRFSRRELLKGTEAFGISAALSHFFLLGPGIKHVFADACTVSNPNACPGGASPDDVCTPAEQGDYCPGDAPPQDECPPSTDVTLDVCPTGDPSTDSCDPGSNWDECYSGESPEDKCVTTSPQDADICPTGLHQADDCGATQGTSEDFCPGGHSSVDTCGEPPEKLGDECGGTGQLDEHDRCNASHADVCDRDNDDVCTTGTNVSGGAGLNDSCETGLAYIGTDVCPGDGGTVLDLCIQGEPGNGDQCPGTGAGDECTVDVDECPGGMSPGDVCSGGGAPEDECPGGGSPDECPGGSTDVDEIPGT